jgi:hypothetical protein
MTAPTTDLDEAFAQALADGLLIPMLDILYQGMRS